MFFVQDSSTFSWYSQTSTTNPTVKKKGKEGFLLGELLPNISEPSQIDPKKCQGCETHPPSGRLVQSAPSDLPAEQLSPQGANATIETVLSPFHSHHQNYHRDH